MISSPERRQFIQGIIDEQYRAYSDEDIKVMKVTEAPGMGYGVYANRDFKPGELIIEICGPIYDKDEYEGSWYCMELGDRFLMEPDAPGALVNHSCSPNSVLIGATEYSLAIVAQSYIRTGVQITYDYGWEPVDDMVRCLCGSPVCRGWPVAREYINDMKRMLQKAKAARQHVIPAIRTSGSAVIPAESAESRLLLLRDGPQPLSVPRHNGNGHPGNGSGPKRLEVKCGSKKKRPK